MRRGQAGFSIVTAIFLIVMLAALGVFAVSLHRVQQTTATLDELGARAYQAAQAGIDWGVWRLLRGGGDCSSASSDLTLPGTLSSFVVSVRCLSSEHSEAGNPVIIYRLTATACNQPSSGVCPDPAPGANYVERQVQGVVGR